MGDSIPFVNYWEFFSLVIQDIDKLLSIVLCTKKTENVLVIFCQDIMNFTDIYINRQIQYNEVQNSKRVKTINSFILIQYILPCFKHKHE